MRFILMIAVLILNLSGIAIANPTVKEFFPSRPADSHALSIDTGIFMRYQLYTDDNMIEAIITLRDDVTGIDRSYYLSENAVLNGAVLRCPNAANERSYSDAASMFASKSGLCRSLPTKIIAGKTRLALLYWPFDLRSSRGASYATDEVLSLP